MRMKMLKKLKEVKSPTTHQCPECLGDAYCAIEDGKSANLCWCMFEERIGNPITDTCLCKNCLGLNNE